MNTRMHSLGPLVGVLALGCSSSAPATRSEPPTPTPTAEQAEHQPAQKSAAAPDRQPEPLEAIDWSAHFADQQGCFAMLSVPGERWVMNDSSRCKEAFRPFSTFKIANSLIGLETGVLASADTVIKWDARAYPASDWWPENWKEDNDLRLAFRRSALPYFRKLATRIGESTMKTQLDRLGYGNRDISGGQDLFWLTGGLAISAVEQIEFLRALHEGRLPVSQRSRDIVEDIMVQEQVDTHVLRAKTGTGMAGEGHALGWFVGFVERAGAVHYFAINRSGTSYDQIPRKQTMTMARTLLSQLGALP